MAVHALDARSSALPRETRPGVLRRYPQLTISPAVLVALLAAWWLATDVLGAPSYVLPPPQDVLRALVAGLSRSPWDKAGYWYHAGVTVWEAVLGFAIGSALGALLGLVLSHWPILGKSWYPYIVGFQSAESRARAADGCVVRLRPRGQGVHHCDHHVLPSAGEHDGRLPGGRPGAYRAGALL